MSGDPFPAPAPSRPFSSEVGRDPGRLRVGLLTGAPLDVSVDDDCVAAARDAANLLAELGHQVVEDAPAALFDEDLLTDFRIRSGANIASQLDAWSAAVGAPIDADDVEPLTWFIAEAGRATPAPVLAGALGRLQTLSRRLIAWWDSFDILLTPTLATTTPPLGWFHDAPDPATSQLRANQMIAFTMPWNASGQPAISAPLGFDARGLPLGVQLVAAPYREDLLLRVASQLEAASVWPTRRPEGLP